MESPIPISVGTCAWSHEDWRGVFYPESLPDHQRLAYYARYLRAVEVDSTFYGVPSRKAAEHWLEATPADFVFACKLPREMSHDRKLRACEVLLSEFLEGLEPLMPKLGCVLIQLPPHFHPADDELALREFIRGLPSNIRFAVEFREAGWHLPRIAHLFEEHRICWVWNDLTPLDHRDEGAFNFLARTTDFLYLRLMGDLTTKYDPDGEAFVYRRLLWSRQASLENWAAKVRHEQEAVSRVLIFANNHFEGYAPETCRRIGEQLGLEIRLPELEAAQNPDHEERQLDLRL